LAQKGNVSPSEIIEQARELELQYSTACEATRSSYAAERRSDFSLDFARFVESRMLLNEHLKMEAAEEDGSARGANLLSSELRKIDSVADDQDAVGSVNVKEQQPNSVADDQDAVGSVSVKEQQPSEMTDLLQMSDVAVLTSNRLRPFGPMNIFVNIIYQQMLRDAMVKRSNSVTGVRRHYPNYQERLKLLADYCSVRSSMTDCDEQPQTNESDEQLEHLRDTVAMELGTVLTKTFWPKTFTGDDKLELFLDVIGKFLGVKHFSWG
uniref:DUF5601 domain-containing protein n=1 Tax=Gongylonema pulchrum TaxID=637853 RepID=A0A183EL43_9BILA